MKQTEPLYRIYCGPLFHFVNAKCSSSIGTSREKPGVLTQIDCRSEETIYFFLLFLDSKERQDEKGGTYREREMERNKTWETEQFTEFCNNFPFSKTNMPMKVFCIADPFTDSAAPERISIIKTFPQFSVYRNAGNKIQSQYVSLILTISDVSHESHLS